jgi:hypothetical protein
MFQFNISFEKEHWHKKQKTEVDIEWSKDFFDFKLSSV